MIIYKTSKIYSLIKSTYRKINQVKGMDGKGSGVLEGVVEGKEKTYRQRHNEVGSLPREYLAESRDVRKGELSRQRGQQVLKPLAGKSMAGLKGQHKVSVPVGELLREQIIRSFLQAIIKYIVFFFSKMGKPLCLEHRSSMI